MCRETVVPRLTPPPSPGSHVARGPTMPSLSTPLLFFILFCSFMCPAQYLTIRSRIVKTIPRFYPNFLISFNLLSGFFMSNTSGAPSAVRFCPGAHIQVSNRLLIDIDLAWCPLLSCACISNLPVEHARMIDPRVCRPTEGGA